MEAPDYLSPRMCTGWPLSAASVLCTGTAPIISFPAPPVLTRRETLSIRGRGGPDGPHPGKYERPDGKERGSLSDLKQAIVYLRDWADRETVRNRLMDSPLAAVPHVMLKAPVCRPGWLVEIDGIAVNGAGESAFAPCKSCRSWNRGARAISLVIPCTEMVS